MQTARDVKDKELGRRIVAAALHLKEHGWAVVDDVLPRCISHAAWSLRHQLPCKKLPCICWVTLQGDYLSLEALRQALRFGFLCCLTCILQLLIRLTCSL